MKAKYKIVPVEPSQEMLDEAAEWLYGCSRARAIEIAKEEKFDSYCNDAEKVWSSMIGLCETTLSDLEIVQKALEMSALVDDRPASLDLLAYGRWTVWNYKETSAHQLANGNDLESLLTWAKQTVGHE